MSAYPSRIVCLTEETTEALYLLKDRIVASDEVVSRQPDVIIASWCGKRVRSDVIAGRPGWSDVPATQNGHIYEIHSSLILQPGPAALTDGIRQLQQIIIRVARAAAPPPSLPGSDPGDDRSRGLRSRAAADGGRGSPRPR
jgi:iron complex transport system substrate-binding protein